MTRREDLDSPDSDAPIDIDERELQRRLVHAMARLVARFAGAFEMPLAELVDLVQAAHLQILRERGLTLGDIGRRMDVSERHAKRLLKQLRESFLDTERSYDLPVRIEFMLWAQPMSTARLKQVLKDEAAAIDSAVLRLVESGRVVIEPGGRSPTLRPASAVQSLVRDTWLARIGALNSFIGSLGDAVYGRFVDSSPKAFARTLNFLVREEDGPELQRFFNEQLVPFMTQLDAKAASPTVGSNSEPAAPGGEAETSTPSPKPADSYRLSICWAPYESMTRAVEAREALASNEAEPEDES